MFNIYKSVPKSTTLESLAHWRALLSMGLGSTREQDLLDLCICSKFRSSYIMLQGCRFAPKKLDTCETVSYKGVLEEFSEFRECKAK